MIREEKNIMYSKYSHMERKLEKAVEEYFLNKFRIVFSAQLN